MGWVADIVTITFCAIVICLVIINAIRENLIDKNVIFDEKCPKCQSELRCISCLASHKILSSILFVNVKYYECGYCHTKRLYIGPRGQKMNTGYYY